MSQQPYVSIRDLRFRYPGSPEDVLRIPVLTISGRGVIALTGPSGAGKSMLVELLAGTLREPYDGSVQVLGTELKTLTRDTDRQRHVRRVGLIPQDYGLLPGLTVEGILRQDLADAEVPKAEHAERIARALGQVELSDFAQRQSERLSGGQRQRVAIARMLARDVDLVIADEPTANLDPELVGETVHLLRRLAERVPVIVVTHDARVAEQCGRTIVLQAMAPTAPTEASPTGAATGFPRWVALGFRSPLLLAALIGVLLLGGVGAALALHNALSSRSGSPRTATSRTQVATHQAIITPTQPSRPPGVWCPQVLGVGQGLTPNCEMIASASAAGSEGPGTAQDKLGGQPVAETCAQGGQCAWLSGSAVAEGVVSTPWAIVGECSPNSPDSSAGMIIYATLLYNGIVYYSWGTLPCVLSSPSSYYEFRRAAPGLVRVWALGNATVTGWDVILVQR